MNIKLKKCALCKKEVEELRESHIIPKLVYRRAKSQPNSQFRNLYNVNEIMRDGEKKEMLCSECELFFNKFETPYANKTLDPYLKSGDIVIDNKELFDDYVFSMSWRSLFDDLFVHNSLTNFCDISQIELSNYERILHTYLYDKLGGKDNKITSEIQNYIYKIRDFNYPKEVVDFCKKFVNSYCFDNPDTSTYFVLTTYLGMVICTVYTPKDVITINQGNRKLNVKKIINKELDYQISNAGSKFIESRDILDKNGQLDKISKRYK